MNAANDPIAYLLPVSGTFRAIAPHADTSPDRVSVTATSLNRPNRSTWAVTRQLAETPRYVSRKTHKPVARRWWRWWTA